MDFCEKYSYFRVLPEPTRTIVWSWQATNGTMFPIPTGSRRSSAADCIVELTNVCAAILTFISAASLIIKYKCDRTEKFTSAHLPFHTTRTFLSIALLLALLLELCESLLVSISLTTIVTIFAVVACCILHRATEIRNGLGTILTGAGFTIIGLARAWRLLYMCRRGLSIENVRATSTAIVAAFCGLLAVIDSYTLYRTMRKSKRYTIRQLENTRTSYKHSTSPCLSKITFHWVTDILSRGYHSSIELHDLGDLPKEETAEYQFQRFRELCRNEKYTLKSELSLWRCLWKRIWLPFAAGGILKLFGDATTLIGPMAISKIMEFVSITQNSTKTVPTFYRRGMTFSEILENGYFLGIIVFLAALLQSTLSQASTHILCVEGIRLRTAIQASIYDKALHLCSWNITEEEKPVEKEKDSCRRQQDADIGTLTNLVAEDAYNVMSFFWIGHYVWAIPLKITAIIFLLYVKLGVSAIVGAICCILIVTPMQLIIGKRMSTNSKRIAERSDARLRLVNEILQGMRLVKLRAWEDIFNGRLRESRNQELKLLDKESVYWTLINFLTHASSVLTTLFTFGVYFWLEEKNLDAGNVFASLALFSQLTVPLFIFPVMVPIIINAMVSATRIEEFLKLPEIVDVLPEIIDERSELPEDTLSKTNSYIESDADATKVHSVTTFGSLGDIEEDEENDELSQISAGYNFGIDSSVETVFEKDPEVPDLVAKITSGVFSWGSDESQLVVDELGFARGQLTLVTGKTGSGKTSLLLALLGEIQRIAGTVEWTKGLKVAYVAQKPWLLNATLRENILFGSAYRPRRYRNVLRACALQPDVDILPGQDLTRIGEKGINLSGGQKQRVTIARAIYSDADVVIMDDPMSALDQQVGKHIFDSAIRRLLLRSGRTVIMVTHRLEFLSAAHEIIVMDGCRIRAVGTKSVIEDSDPVLAEEWKRAALKREDERRIQKTAKDRWSLIRLVSRISINVRNKHATDGSWITDQEAHVSPPVFIPLRMRRSTLSESRYLTNDLTDLPVPSEEWNVVKKRSKHNQNAVRSSSLQPQRRPALVLRQNSTPTMLERSYVVPRKRHNTVDNGQSSNVLKQLFSGRINGISHEESLQNGEKSVLCRLMSSNSNKSPHERYRRPVKRLLSVESKGIDNVEDEEEKNDEYEEQEKQDYEDTGGFVTKRTWLDYPSAGGWIPGLTYIVAALVCQALRIYTDLWLSRWTEQGSQASDDSHETTIFYFNVYISLSVGSIILSFMFNAAGQWAGARARRRLHEEAISGLLRAPISFFERNPVGRILNRFSGDMGVIDKKICTSIQRLTSFVLLCGSAMIVNVIISPWFLIAAVPICSAYYFLQSFYRLGARQLQRLDGSTRGPVTTHFSQTLSGLPTLRASKQEDRFMDEAMKHLDANTNAFLILNTSNRWLGIALDYLGAVIVVTAIFTALISAELYPTWITPALVGLAINYTLLVPIYLNWVVKFTAEIEMYMGSIARLSAYTNGPTENYKDKDGLRVPDEWPNKGEVIFEDASLRYDSRRDPVVTKLSFKIPSGQKVGICGRTGSGKSSTVMALFQMIEINQGRVTIDGIDIRQVPLRTLRSRLSGIPQDVIMFSGTIRENLDPLSEHDDEEVWAALELAQMKNVIACHPEGLNLEVREGGENFSVGQLQLLCMARAVLQRSNIIVLDEATSALDAATEKSLLKATATAFENKTVIVIAHRPTALLHCDRIIVFDEGKIVEEGTPEELIRKTAGFFSSMLKATEHNDRKT